ncbi:hypothetical protein [Sphingomonas montanisoli]|uniref:hypothetical protein n=1 Tax=Sphingomonas montanisoli TaxID=2606412 RepID=UPI0015E186B8|nr:hypothetical protein [Sphingomonas montanisoli]
MSPWIEAAMAKYGWIWIGLTFGLAAKYALLIKRGIRIRPALVLADVLLLPLVALIAYTMVNKLGADGETAALVTALATVGADRLVKLYMERFVQRVDIELRSMAEQQKAVIRNEVQTEISGHAVIEDHAAGRAPSEYVSLRKPPVG